MKDNIENMTIKELVEKANARIDNYLFDAGAVIGGLDVAKEVIGDILMEEKSANEAYLLYTLTKCADEEHKSFSDDIGNLFCRLIEAVNEPEKKGAVKA